MSAPDVRLVVAGEDFGDWESFEVESDLLQPADAFSFVAANIGGSMAGKISKFDTVKVVVDSSLVMVGFVDDITYRDSRINVVGRDNFGHLVDCSAAPKTYKNQTLLTMAQALGGRYVPSWQVRPGVTLPVHRWLKVEPGETIIDVLQRIAKKDGVLLWLDAQGVGQIGKPDYTSQPSHVIRHYTTKPASGLNNVTSAEVRLSARGLYSQVTLLGASGNSAGRYGKQSLQKQTDLDVGVPIVRELIVTDGDVKSIKEAKARATEEVDRRAFESTTLNYTSKGFKGEPAPGQTASLFETDQRVVVTDEPSGIDGVYYLTRRRFKLGNDGHTTELELHEEGWMA